MSAYFPNEGEIVAMKQMIVAPMLKVVLFANDVTITAATVYADMTLATFSGYAAVTPTWGAPATDANGKAWSQGSACLFQGSGGGVTNSIYGYALVSQDVSLVNRIVMIEKIAGGPKTMGASGSIIVVAPIMRCYNP